MMIKTLLVVLSLLYKSVTSISTETTRVGYTLDLETLTLTGTDSSREFVRCQSFDYIFHGSRVVESWADCVEHGDACTKRTKIVHCDLTFGSDIPRTIHMIEDSLLAVIYREEDVLIFKDAKTTESLTISRHSPSGTVWEASLQFCLGTYARHKAHEFFGIILESIAVFAKQHVHFKEDMYNEVGLHLSNMLRIRRLEQGMSEYDNDDDLSIQRSVLSVMSRKLHRDLERKVEDSYHPSFEFEFRRRWRETETASYQRYMNLSSSATDVVLSRVLLKFSFFPFEIFTHLPKACMYISRGIVQFGLWEAEKANRIVSLMQDSRSRVFVDVGANIGLYTVAVAAQAINVISIEPSTRNTNLLKASLSRNGLERFVSSVPNLA